MLSIESLDMFAKFSNFPIYTFNWGPVDLSGLNTQAPLNKYEILIDA